MPAKRKLRPSAPDEASHDWSSYRDMLSKLRSITDLLSQFRRGFNQTQNTLRDIREGIFKTAVQAVEHEKLFGSRDKLRLADMLVNLVKEDAFKLSNIDKSMLEVN